MNSWHPRTFDDITTDLENAKPSPGCCTVMVHQFPHGGSTLLRYGIRFNADWPAYTAYQEHFDYAHTQIRLDVVADNPVTRSILAMLAMDDLDLFVECGTRDIRTYRQKLFLALCSLWD